MLKGCLNNSQDAMHHSSKLKRGHQHHCHMAPADPISRVVSQHPPHGHETRDNAESDRRIHRSRACPVRT